MQRSWPVSELPFVEVFVTSPGTPDAPAASPLADNPQRPELRLLLWYSFGGTLPPRYNTWVLHDVTCRTWWLRHFARVFVIIAPLSTAFFLFVPDSGGAALYTGVALTGTLVLMSVIFMLIDADRRAVRAGYPFSYASELRSRRATEAQRLDNYQRRERIAARKARRYNKHGKP
jgi:Family of unknown function (DUF5313)